MKVKYLFLSLILILVPSIVEGYSSTVPHYFITASKRFHIDVDLLYALCSVESRCRISAINKDDATKEKKARGVVEHSVGLFQMKLATARGLGFTGTKLELLKPEVNTWYASKLLRHLHIRYGADIIKVLSAYNAGTYTTKNKRYVNLVLRKYALNKLNGRI